MTGQDLLRCLGRAVSGGRFATGIQTTPAPCPHESAIASLGRNINFRFFGNIEDRYQFELMQTPHRRLPKIGRQY